MSEYTIYGNYTEQSTEKFPLDCEGLLTIQDNIKILSCIAMLSGCDKLIITGCAESGAVRTAGYVYIKEPTNPVGEILYHPQQAKSNTCYIASEDISVTADNETFANAYTKRWLADGTGTTSYNWSSFVNVSTLSNSALRSAISEESIERTSAISEEASARTNADNAEATARTSADNALSARVSFLEVTHLYQHTYIFDVTCNIFVGYITTTIMTTQSTPLTLAEMYSKYNGKSLAAHGKMYGSQSFAYGIGFNDSNFVVWYLHAINENILSFDFATSVSITRSSVIQIY